MDNSVLRKLARQARKALFEGIASRLPIVLEQSRNYPAHEVSLLRQAIKINGKVKVIESAASSWFNRFCAFRYLDLHRYGPWGAITPPTGSDLPEILVIAISGKWHGGRQRRIKDALDAHDPELAYRLLLLDCCVYWRKYLPFMFQLGHDALLLPDSLLSASSPLNPIRSALTSENCQAVEILGTLYQYFISEKKDAIINNKNRKIGPADLPAATQLFTPPWIVRYLVDNSLGRLWVLNRPESDLPSKMSYFIPSDQEDGDFAKIPHPCAIKVCDPACGSGHMLVYAFDLLYSIYLEDSDEDRSIPCLILENNLFGIEIDPLAANLAAFALAMKARALQADFFETGITPHICTLENVKLSTGEEQELYDSTDFQLAKDFASCVHQFGDSTNTGSLIRPNTREKVCHAILDWACSQNSSERRKIKAKVHKIASMALYLCSRYEVVITNPPYMGVRGMNKRLAAWVADQYPSAKADLFAAFILRCLELTAPGGQLGLMTPIVWMFLSTYGKLRGLILEKETVTTLVQLEYSGFEDAVVPVCAFTLQKSHIEHYKTAYIRLHSFKGSTNQGPKTMAAIANPQCGWFYRAAAEDFKAIPGRPLAYWVNANVRKIFEQYPAMGELAEVRQGLATANNSRFVRLWHEVDVAKIGFGINSLEQAAESEYKWFPYNKGGDFRKWYGNLLYIIDWEKNGEKIKATRPKAIVRNQQFYFKPCISWSKVSSSRLAMRYWPAGAIFDVAGPCIFADQDLLHKLLAFSNTSAAQILLEALSPTLNFEVGQLSRLPASCECQIAPSIASELITIAKEDWDSSEISWDFQSLPLLNPTFRRDTLESACNAYLAHCQALLSRTRQLEEQINSIFINDLGLEMEANPAIPCHEITLTCNPAYRYKYQPGDPHLQLMQDIVKDVISYAVGCMFGRYALHKPGLILASQGQTIGDYEELAPDSPYQPIVANVLLCLEENWFLNDITPMFIKFLEITFGVAHSSENLAFIEDRLGKDIRTYFRTDFFAEHLKRYKKRPIYWLVESPSGTFRAFVYMHRYDTNTFTILLKMLRQLIARLNAERERLENVLNFPKRAGNTEKKSAIIKKLRVLARKITELQQWQNQVIRPLAAKKIKLNLDDGVRRNYPKFYPALKKIPGLDKIT